MPHTLPTLLLLHGLTANRCAFDGLKEAGLSQKYNVLTPDLRGRGNAPKPATGYTMAEHAHDIIAFLDKMGLHEPLMLGGHSFGGFLALHIAKHFPERVSKLVILDAAVKMPPETRERLVPALSRLGHTFESFEVYLQKIKSAPYLSFWEASMESYFRADVQEIEAGKVMPIPQIAHIAQCVQAVLSEPVEQYIHDIQHPISLFFATDEYTLGAPLIPREYAEDTLKRIPHAMYHFVAGNHQTMLYGEGARQVVQNL